ncbi:MAG: hypothetical protein N0E44_21330 [Candidatus Thiodiazotropha lotti]|nr:hypothetical protein [Candidatus Thiodiazotropha lotti]MCW4222417.1 hypothetical protein [Candidatus Thiodiazotropha lotti]
MIKRIHNIDNGYLFHIEAYTQNGPVMSHTLKVSVKAWRSLMAAVKWMRVPGFDATQIDNAKWHVELKEFG